MRLSFYVLFAMTFSAFFYNLAVVFIIVCVVVMIVVQPYKKEYENFNILDTVMMLLMALEQASLHASTLPA